MSYPEPKDEFQAKLGLALLAKYRIGNRDKDDEKFIIKCFKKLKVINKK